ncbi:Ty1/Copia family ribonuclease HI [Aurantimicrobium minutum]|uniref:Ty1/Copia family ribonuclease HI n=1 Tax=Aurantimicrobium minutum TaxID=708131 RepID=UPI00248D8C68|nr:polyprotein of Ty1/Copia retrotransposon [Aurantimicrobium minutum]
MSLLSIGQLCDAGCQATFDATTASITYNNKVILTGTRSTATNKLWHLDHPLSTTQTEPVALAAVNQSASPESLVEFAHAALFSPAPSTLYKALQRGFLPPFPGLDAKSFLKHTPRSEATIKGHLDAARKNQNSTKDTTPSTFDPILQDLLEDAFPPAPFDGERTNMVYAAFHEIRGAVHSDLTGRFPIPSSSGNHYILVVYCYDANAILMLPLQNRKAETILTAYKEIVRKLVAGGCRPKLQRMDNECSTLLKEYMQAENIDYQLVPPHDHRRNAAERAIRTAKNHFVAGLCSVDPQFPMSQWDKLLPQAELTLNLLRGSRINPKLSAYEQLFGRYDFNRTPIAPPGIKVLAYVKSKVRKTWAPHAIDGYYVGPAMDSYRCYTVYLPSTGKTRIIDTLTWLPVKHNIPLATPTDLLRATLQDLKTVLKEIKQPTNTPIPLLPPTELDMLQTLTEVLTNKDGNATEQIHVIDPLTLPVEPEKKVKFAPDIPEIQKLPKASTKPPAQDLRVPPNLIPPDDEDTPIINSQPENAPELRVVPTNTPIQATPEETNTPHIIPPSPTRKQPRRRAKRKQVSYFAATDTAVVTATKLLDQSEEEIAYIPTPEGFACTAINPDTNLPAEYRELRKSKDGEYWEQGMCNEIGRLFQGYKEIKGTNTCRWIKVQEMPKDRKATYVRIVVADRPLKAEPRRVRITVGGDKVDYPGEVSTKTTELVTCKILLNAVVSTPGAQFMTMDLKDFFLGNPLPRKEYARIPVHLVPAHIVELYNLQDYEHDGHYYIEISKGMYGLPQASRVAYDALAPRLKDAGYTPAKTTPGLFKHASNSIIFCLTVDDFGVLYVDRTDAEHLRDTLKQHYVVTEDWTGKNYCGLTLDWDYVNRTVRISMPGYVAKALQRFEIDAPKRAQHAPHKHLEVKYGAKQQYVPEPDLSPALQKAEIKRLQEIIGTFLFYARAVDSTMLPALGTLAQAQTRGTTATMEAAVQLLNYAATHPDAEVTYKKSDMVLHIHSDASYLSEEKARSRVGGYYFLNGKDDPTETREPELNGGIHTECRILRPVMASAAEAETAALFHNGQEGAAIRNILEEMGFPQPGPTPIQCDNTVATGLANDTVKAKRTKAMDMRFYWIKDRVKQGHFRIYWKPGDTNLADYFTKHHPPSHHQQMRYTYLSQPKANEEPKSQHPSALQCEGVLIRSGTPSPSVPSR